MTGGPHKGYANDPAVWLSDRPVSLVVTGGSMEPFLKEGDRVEVVRTSPDELGRGQIIVMRRGRIQQSLKGLPASSPTPHFQQ